MLAFSHGDPPSNALVRLDGTIVLVDLSTPTAGTGDTTSPRGTSLPARTRAARRLSRRLRPRDLGLDALIVWRTVQVVGMNQVELLDADREFAPGWSRARCYCAAAAVCTNRASCRCLARSRRALAESAEQLPAWD
jgi:hypothetical protein